MLGALSREAATTAIKRRLIRDLSMTSWRGWADFLICRLWACRLWACPLGRSGQQQRSSEGRAAAHGEGRAGQQHMGRAGAGQGSSSGKQRGEGSST